MNEEAKKRIIRGVALIAVIFLIMSSLAVFEARAEEGDFFETWAMSVGDEEIIRDDTRGILEGPIYIFASGRVEIEQRWREGYVPENESEIIERTETRTQEILDAVENSIIDVRDAESGELLFRITILEDSIRNRAAQIFDFETYDLLYTVLPAFFITLGVVFTIHYKYKKRVI